MVRSGERMILTVAQAADEQSGPPFGRGRGQGGRGAGRGFGRGPGGGGPGGGEHGQGDDQFEEDHNVFFYLLEHRDQIDRTVTNLPNGIETLTESKDSEVAGKIREHVAAMYDRVENGKGIHMRDPLFREIFTHAAKIKMELKDTERGVLVRETSDDPYVAKLLQEHAKTVNLFIKNGFSEMPKNHPLPPRDEPPAPSAANSKDATCTECQLNSFADFDRVYIPALALTNQEKPVEAKAAMARFSKRWNGLRSMLGECREDWSESLTAVDTAITKAELLIAEGELKQAHEALEVIRDIFMKLRSENNIQYPLDSLNQFHATMEQIVKPAMSMTPDAVDPNVRARFVMLAKQAAEEWKTVEQTEFDAELFLLKGDRVEKLQQLIAAESQRIQALQTAVEAEAPQLLKAASELKPAFAAVYMFFGDFASVKALTSSAAAEPKYIYPKIEGFGKVVQFSDAADQPRAGSKICVDLTAGGDSSKLNAALEKVARFVNIYAGAGRESADAAITVVLHGDATPLALSNSAYAARFGTADNPNEKLISELRSAGVELLVCGQALSHKGFGLDEVSEQVQVAVSALTVNVNRASDGYAAIRLD
ncbi:MAG: DsrE family protein [Planctomycetaceae bacterium]|nr:DsrE family protein [Planctomycetaceae bacterium]